MAMYQANMFVPSIGGVVTRYVEAGSLQSAKSMLEACFIGNSVKSIKKIDKPDVDGYVVIPSHRTMW